MLSNGRECKCKTAKIDRHIKGVKVLWNESSLETKVPGSEKAWERKGQGANWPGSEKARERKDQGAKVPGSELARVLLADSLRGANWPGSEKARYLLLVTRLLNDPSIIFSLVLSSFLCFIVHMCECHMY